MPNTPDPKDRFRTPGDPAANRTPGEGGGQTDGQETTPAEERGERLDTGKTIARGGKQGGCVPGAEEPRH